MITRMLGFFCCADASSGVPTTKLTVVITATMASNLRMFLVVMSFLSFNSSNEVNTVVLLRSFSSLRSAIQPDWACWFSRRSSSRVSRGP